MLERNYKIMLYVFILFYLQVSTSSAQPGFDEDSYVTTLTPANFNDIVGGAKGVLVEFYAPWCKHCKSLVPVYEMVAHAFQREKRVVIAKLDAIAHPEIKEHFDVGGFPTLKWFPPKQQILKPIDFKGSRTTQTITDFVNEQAGTRVTLQNPAARENRVPTLTPEAKERAKQRWMENFNTQKHTGGDESAPSKKTSVFKPPPVAGKDGRQDGRLRDIPESMGDFDEEERSRLDQRREELRQRLEFENSNTFAKTANKPGEGTGKETKTKMHKRKDEL